MKKTLCLLACLLAALLLPGAALADDTGIQIISEPESASGYEALDMDDVKVDDVFLIDGFGDITIVSADWTNSIGITSGGSIHSGDEAELFLIIVRIDNTQKKPVDFLKQFGDVICDYADGYQFGGWKRQAVLDGSRFKAYSEGSSKEIDVLYTGYYCVGVTLPNRVMERDEPLSVTFSIGNNEFTCNVRK